MQKDEAITVHDVAVIGAGPAGCAAAVQCERLGLDIVLLDTLGKAGGLVREARLLENYPGLEKPVTGPEFALRLASIISANDLEVQRFHAHSIEITGNTFLLSGDDEFVRSRAVIIAVGTVPKKFGIRVDGITRIHRSVIELMHNPPERAVIIGSGEAAVDYALNLSDSGVSVTILARGSRLKVTGVLLEKIGTSGSVKILYNTVPVSAFQANGVVNLEVESSGGKVVLQTDSVLAAVGREPLLPYISNDFVHDAGCVRTSIPGLYLAGDASLGSLGQTAIASGQGVQAAVYVFGLIKAERGKL